MCMSEAPLPLGWRKPTKSRSTSKSGSTSLLSASAEGHLITVAPTGAGKGVSAVIPALLSWQGPAIVIDPKGEAYHVTHHYRQNLGQKVHVLDPFGVVTDTSDRLNPIDLLVPDSPHIADDAAMIASLLAAGMTKPSDPFWDERASTLITGLILYQQNALGTLSTTLEYVRHELFACVQAKANIYNALVWSPITEVAAAGNILCNDGRVLNSILSTAQSHIGFIRSGPVAECLQNSTIALEDIQSGAPLTLYLVLPPDKLISHGRLLRLWIATLLTTLARRREIPAEPTLLLIDEAAQLGRLDALLTAVTLLRGYGVKVWSFWQDLAQVASIYGPDALTLLNNCWTQQFLAPASPRAAFDIETYLADSSPLPLASLDADDVLITRQGKRPHVYRRVDYRRDAMFAGRFADNPFYRNRAAKPQEPALPDNVYPFPEQRV